MATHSTAKEPKQKLGSEQILFVKDRERSAERVIASFPLNADESLITAHKAAEITRCRAAGLDTNALQFRVAREKI